mgnify:CR=1 FL=1
MSKEKKSKNDSVKKETPFFFETIGFGAIILVIIVFGELGKIGTILNVFFMVIFGDWYWLIVMFILFFGLSNIFTHKKFDFKNQRYIGYLICSLGLIVLSHFTIHRAVINANSSQSYISLTWSHYRNFISIPNSVFPLGGGILGAIIFYIIYFLLGTLGVSLISIIIFILGFTMIVNRSLVEIVKYLYNKIRNIRKFTFSFNEFFRYEIGKKKVKEKVDIYTNDKLINIKNLDTYQNEMNFSFQDKESFELKSLMVSIFNTMSVEYREIDIRVSFAVTVFKYFIYSNFNYEVLLDKLQSLIEEKVFVTRYNNNISIEVNNKYVSLLTIKNLLIKQSILNNYNLVIGLNTENEIEEVDFSRDGNFLIVGKENVGIRNFIYYLICSMFIKVKIINYEFELYDEQNTFGHLDLFRYTYNNNTIDYLNKIIEEIDERTSIIKKHNFHTMDEYNKALEIEEKENIRRKFVVFNYTTTESKKVIEDKLMYIIQMGRIAGISIIIIIRDVNIMGSVLVSVIKNKLIFKLNDNKESVNLLGDNRSTYLDNKGEAIFFNKEKQIRLQTALVSDEEINRILKAF